MALVCLITCIYTTTGFNGRGVLPGVATGNGLKPKSGKLEMKMTSSKKKLYDIYMTDWIFPIAAGGAGQGLGPGAG